MGKFEIFKSDQYYFRLRSKNNEIILSSEGYKAKQSCQNGIDSVKMNAVNDKRYNRKDSENNYTFNLKANNGEIIGRSENYTTSSAREDGISAVRSEAPHAHVVDLTNVSIKA